MRPYGRVTLPGGTRRQDTKKDGPDFFRARYSPPPRPPGFAQRNGEGTQKAQFRAQDAQKRRAKDVLLCFLWLLCASCVPFPSRCAKPRPPRGGEIGDHAIHELEKLNPPLLTSRPRVNGAC